MQGLGSDDDDIMMIWMDDLPHTPNVDGGIGDNDGKGHTVMMEKVTR